MNFRLLLLFSAGKESNKFYFFKFHITAHRIFNFILKYKDLQTLTKDIMFLSLL